VYVPEISAPVSSSAPIALPENESHHLCRVLRVKRGDAIVIFDGRGSSWDAEIVDAGKRVTAKITTTRAGSHPRPARVSLAVGLLKGDAMDAVVRDATALGVREIVPMITAHAIVPKRARGEEAVERWRRVAVASAKQCGQLTLPAIGAVTDLKTVLARPDGTKLMCVEPALGGASLSAVAADGVLVLVGPEGGWSEEEVVRARAAHCHTVTLGPLTLRAELAPVVAVTTVWNALAN